MYRPHQTNGFAELFNRTIKKEYFDIVVQQKLYTSVERLQVDLSK